MTPSRQEKIAPDRNQDAGEWFSGVRRRVREAIEESGLERKEIARRLDGNFDTNYGQVSRWANENVTPDTAALLQLPAILGVNGHWLLTGDGDRKLQPGEADDVVGVIRQLVNPDPEVPDEERREWMDRLRELLPFEGRVAASSGGDGP